MNVIFFGTSDFGIPALMSLGKVHTVVAVVTVPSKPQGRGRRVTESPIAVYAREQGFAPVFTPEDLNDCGLREALVRCGADIFVVVAFRILPKSLFLLPPLGTLNIHASLLPKYRGPAPIQRAIEAGEQETGVTVFRIDEGVDTGGILLQKGISISSNETSVELYTRLSDCGAVLLLEALEGLQQGTLRPFPQDKTPQASYAPKLTKMEARIDWRQPAVVIHNKIRAFKPFPGTHTLLDGKRLELERAEPVALSSPAGEAGIIAAAGDSFFDVRCGEGFLRVLEVKPEGRRSMSVHDFLMGHKIDEGTRLS